MTILKQYPNNIVYHCLISLTALSVISTPALAATDIPHLVKRGTATQLIVQGKPYIMLGGELHNSSSTSLAYMEPMWDKLEALNLNTVLAALPWELIEPEEGRYDFSLVDGLIKEARRHNLKLVFLWFGSWKNGVSSYAPAWVRSDSERFPRALGRHQNKKDVLSPFAIETMCADARAFAALMRHIRFIDERDNTVIMMQVENEIGIRPESRDTSALAEAAFQRDVPQALMAYLQRHKYTLLPEIRQLWQRSDFATEGTWTEVFGEDAWADEIFMAWHMADYVNTVATAGKAEYPLPMYANAWLVQNDEQMPGDYPCGGPVSRVMDIWRAAAPEIDFLAPDIYLTEFKEVCLRYTRSGNPLMIPEARQGPEAAANAFYAYGRHDAMCFAPFGIEDIDLDHPLVEAYDVLGQLLPLIAKAQGMGNMVGFLETDPNEEVVLESDNYRAHIRFKMGGKPSDAKSFGLAIALGPDEFLFAGRWLAATFSSKSSEFRHAELARTEEGYYKNGQWFPLRKLNGDETAGGTQALLPPNYRDIFAEAQQSIRIIRVKLCRYR